jgi:D-beta-D-heptose 7-phosphate kinase/D-beta-D-heptose 1-phosphate adenosyltransferase
LKQKIKSLVILKKIVSRLKNKGEKIVFTNGCFDLLHYGHVKYLEDAKSKGDILIVAINSDTSVRRIKGNKRPIVNEKDRLRTIAALESVDYVTLFREETPLGVIEQLKPDILIKGADWSKNSMVGGEFVLGYGGSISTIKLVKGRSTTNLIRKIGKIF